MSNAPDHIFAYCWTGQTRSGQWHVNPGYSAPEYVRRDTIHQAALDRIAALEAEKATGWAVNVEGIEPEDGSWRSCSGCHETNEGAETGFYPYSKQFKCYVGAGCRECGGIGVVWDNLDYSDYAESALLEPADQSAIDAAVMAERAKWVVLLRDTASALENFVDTKAKTRPPYEHPLSAYDRAMAALIEVSPIQQGEET